MLSLLFIQNILQQYLSFLTKTSILWWKRNQFLTCCAIKTATSALLVFIIRHLTYFYLHVKCFIKLSIPQFSHIIRLKTSLTLNSDALTNVARGDQKLFPSFEIRNSRTMLSSYFQRSILLQSFQIMLLHSFSHKLFFSQ